MRIGLLIKPTRDITSNTIYDTLVENASPTSNRLIAWFGPNGGTGFGPPAVFQRILQEQQGLGPWKVAENGGTNSATDQLSPLHCAASPLALCRSHSTPQETLRTWGLLNNTQVDFDGFSAKNIIAYRYMHHLNDMSENFVGGSIGGSINGGASVQQNEISQWQDEFQLLGKALDNRLDWVAGAFYMKEWGTENSITYTNSPNWTSGAGRGVNESKGLFAQGTYAVTDKLKATIGVRRNWDHRNAEATAVINNGTGCNERIGNSAVLLPIGNCFIRGDKDWQANTWTLALDYQLDKDTLVYTTHRHGYKSGGFALRAGREVNFPYDPEYVTDWEVGVKSDWSLFDRPVRTNFAYFNLDYTDQQVQVTNSTAVPVTTYIASAGKSKIWGAELEVTYKPTKRLELSGFYSYTNPKYLDYMTPVVGGVVSLNARPFSMNLHNAGLSAAYMLPMDESAGIITLRGDTIFRSKALADNSVAGLAGTAVLNAGFTMTPQAGFGQLNLRADWQRPFGNPVDLGIFVNNVSNYGYVQGGTAVNGIVTANISPPRMWGVELSYKFGEGFKPKE
jgi:iron complex outermembrane receptor protein